MRKSIRTFIALILIVVISMSLMGCSSNNNRVFKEEYDQFLVTIGESTILEWGIVPNRTYFVNYKNGIYTANINGVIQKVKMVDGDINTAEYTTIKDVTDKKILKIVNSAKELVIDYISKSSILKDKDVLIESVKTIPVKYTDADLVAEYKENTIFINEKNKKDVCEWMISHELVHYLCEITNDGIENEPYPYNAFNETITDLITYSMEPEMVEDGMSGYVMYYDFVFPYIGCFKDKAIKAYFYGYDEIYNMVGKPEFDLYVQSLDHVFESEVSLVIINNSINKWGQIS